MDGTIVALEQHLSNTSSTTVVAINLERRMRIKEVRIGTSVGILPCTTVVGQQMEHIRQDLQSMVTIKHSCPEIYLPAQAPTRGHIATLCQRCGSSREQFRMLVGRNLVRRIESIEMGDVTMLVPRVVGINQPLLQLTILANLHRREIGQRGGQTFLQSGILHTQHLHGGENVAQHIEDNLVVHRRACRHSSALSFRSVFRRNGRHRHQPTILRMTLYIVEQELGCPTHHGELLFQEGLIACEQVVLPEMSGQPGTARREHAPSGTIHRSCDAPQVGIMMSHPTATAVHLLRSHRTGLTQIINHREQGLCSLTQITDIRNPIVHLGIDINRIFRIPRRIHLVIPDTLQISGLSTGLRGTDQQITAILEHQSCQIHIASACKGSQTAVSRKHRPVGSGQ